MHLGRFECHSLLRIQDSRCHIPKWNVRWPCKTCKKGSVKNKFSTQLPHPPWEKGQKIRHWKGIFRIVSGLRVPPLPLHSSVQVERVLRKLLGEINMINVFGGHRTHSWLITRKWKKWENNYLCSLAEQDKAAVVRLACIPIVFAGQGMHGCYSWTRYGPCKRSSRVSLSCQKYHLKGWGNLSRRKHELHYQIPTDF